MIRQLKIKIIENGITRDATPAEIRVYHNAELRKLCSSGYFLWTELMKGKEIILELEENE